MMCILKDMNIIKLTFCCQLWLYLLDTAQELTGCCIEALMFYTTLSTLDGLSQ